VSIVDFSFSPGTTTVHVGDTITWTNAGPSPHTATASNGSFDTGILKKGASASHTFTSPGTFAYYCSVHPFMHGTIVVLPAATTPPSRTGAGEGSSGASSGSTGASGQQGSGTSGGSGASATSATSGASLTSSGPSLPRTGLDATTELAVAAALAALGLVLRGVLRLRPALGKPSDGQT
jgi:hypothetical protein